MSDIDPEVPKTPGDAYWYAHLVVDGPCPELEPLIAQDPEASYCYARNVLNGPFLAGETAIRGSAWERDYMALLVQAPEL